MMTLKLCCELAAQIWARAETQVSSQRKTANHIFISFIEDPEQQNKHKPVKKSLFMTYKNAFNTLYLKNFQDFETLFVVSERK